MSRALLVAALLAAEAPAGAAVEDPAAASFTAITQSGRLRATLTPSLHPVPLNKAHWWTLRLEALGAVTVAPIREVGIDGGMPGHKHGLPTTPEIQPGERAGEFRISGLRFHMPGRWDLRLRLRDGNGAWDGAVISVPVGAVVEEPAAARLAGWNAAERALLRSLSLRSLAPPPADPTNAVADNPAAAALGRRLFFEPGLSGNGKISCAGCHDPKKYFTDGQRVSTGIDGAATSRNSPTVVGAAYAPFLFWDGRSDSLWSQALGPLQSRIEMGATRAGVVGFVRSQLTYRRDYEAVFGAIDAGMPVDRAFANVGKALAAYERTLRPGESRFDRYVDAVLLGDGGRGRGPMNDAEIAGLKIFLSPQGGCLQCHNGPLFTNHSFHNIGTGAGVAAAADRDRPDFGRLIGLQALSMDEFNCRGAYRDGPAGAGCPNLDHLNKDDHGGLLEGAFKVPGLRSVARTAPYMHDGRFATLEAVLEHYREPPRGVRHELKAGGFTGSEMADLAAFLRALTEEEAAPVR